MSLSEDAVVGAEIESNSRVLTLTPMQTNMLRELQQQLSVAQERANVALAAVLAGYNITNATVRTLDVEKRELTVELSNG